MSFFKAGLHAPRCLLQWVYSNAPERKFSHLWHHGNGQLLDSLGGDGSCVTVGMKFQHQPQKSSK